MPRPPVTPTTDSVFTPLSPDFFHRSTLTVAKELLGHWLIRVHPGTGEPQRFRIVETEAYTQEDPACHAFGKREGRAACLYEQPGLAYVYLIYGMYNCLNVVTEQEGTAGAVLFRALEPLDWNPETDEKPRTHGPGRLCKALDITREVFNMAPLTDPTQSLYLAQGEPILPHFPQLCVETTRIGITKATDWPWRFCIQDNPWVSVKPGKVVIPKPKKKSKPSS